MKHLTIDITYPITVHQCPVCKDWQVDYDSGVIDLWPIYRIGHDGVTVDLGPFYAAVDEAIHEHLLECPEHAAVEFLLAQAGQPVV